ncbi:MAG: PEP-CTERM sorting domain-containing protein [Cyanobacteriota bacterium]|nr:PEP-CTERM sorting domain-containing protein [Cyanobacteriota bacterium]
MKKMLVKIAAFATSSVLSLGLANLANAAIMKYDFDYRLDSGEIGSSFFNYDDTSGVVDEEWMRYEITDGSFLDWDIFGEDFWFWEANQDGVNGVSAGEAIAFSNSYWEAEDVLQVVIAGVDAQNVGWSGEMLRYELREMSEKEVKKRVPEPGTLIGLLSVPFCGWLLKKK